MKTVNYEIEGVNVVLYPVSTFAASINRDRQTVKLWEKLKLLPKAPFSSFQGKREIRLYPEWFITATNKIIDAMQIRKGKAVDKIIFSSKLRKEIEAQKVLFFAAARKQEIK